MIRIGLVDSGINSDLLHNNRIVNAWKGEFETFHDYLNHGTQCTRLILQNFNDVIIYNVKVFDKNKTTSVKNIITAIRWCIENAIQVINLSLSVDDLRYFSEFVDICDYARLKKCIIVASSDNLRRPCLPAYLNNVIGVSYTKKITCDSEFYFLASLSIQAYLNGSSLLDKTIESTSFATARMTGIISSLIQEDPKNVDFDQLIINLNQRTKATRFEIENKRFDIYECVRPIVLKNNFQSSTPENIIYIGNDIEVNILSRYKDLIDKKNKVTFLSDTLARNKKMVIKILSDIKDGEYILLSPICDNFIINKLFGKKVKIVNDEFNQVLKDLSKIHPQHIFDNSTPICCMINLTNVPDIFCVELELRQLLTRANLSFAQISTDIRGKIYNFNYVFPYYNKLRIDLITGFSKALVESINNTQNEIDCIIASINQTIISTNNYSPYFFNPEGCRELAFLLGLQPDTFILVVDEFTDVHYIQRNISILKNIFANRDFILLYNSIYDRFLTDSDFNRCKFPEEILKYNKSISQASLKIIKKKVCASVFDINKEKEKNMLLNTLKKKFFTN
ncbi:S8 family serine peptidase [Bacteroides fragilis]|uniref:S8 family serine peptidase n=1 Tax=Bacteroides fragilis TaxID=817 RepID=UPI0028115607|nr:S8 family serine peptidase [Bacteroides fragilis]WMI92700.1 hypothetical protein BFGS084_00066 [Bacteroides fragilis]